MLLSISDVNDKSIWNPTICVIRIKTKAFKNKFKKTMPAVLYIIYCLMY